MFYHALIVKPHRRRIWSLETIYTAEGITVTILAEHNMMQDTTLCISTLYWRFRPLRRQIVGSRRCKLAPEPP